MEGERGERDGGGADGDRGGGARGSTGGKGGGAAWGAPPVGPPAPPPPPPPRTFPRLSIHAHITPLSSSTSQRVDCGGGGGVGKEETRGPQCAAITRG
jgi:hypothetical protein